MNWQAVSFDWNQVRAFLATVETGSLSAAARALRSTQPTLSRQVAALEAELGVMLFERVGRSLSLTEPGRALLAHVRTMGEAAQHISLIASGQSQAVDGLVRVTASDVMSAYILPPILKRLQEAAPGIDIEIVASNDVNDLARREADIAIRHVRPDQPDLVARQCASTTSCLYAATSYLDRHGRPDRASDLARAEFVGLTDTTRFLAELNARGLPLTERNLKWRTGSIVVAWELVKQGFGIGVMAREVAASTPGIESVLPGLASFPVPVWLVAHRELHTSRRIRVVFDVLAEALS
jgi:DNA-binding transcriptional LysR family regulator